MEEQLKERSYRPRANGLSILAALFVLNAMLSMTNLWPTPLVQLDARVAPEFVYFWCSLLILAALGWHASTKTILLLSMLFFLLIIGRYMDTTAPALFGRSINLYWDGYQVPRLLWVLSQRHPWWNSALVFLGVLTILTLIFSLTRWAVAVCVQRAAPRALRNRWALAITGFFLISSALNLLGVKATWPYISRPVIPTYVQQAKIFWAAFREKQGDSTLPPSPAFTSDLARLKGADFKLFFLESYGALAYDNAQVNRELEPFREQFVRQLSSRGFAVASAFVTSTTFGGGTDLAHMALQTGIDTRDPIRHDTLLTTSRPTLTRHFKSRGYQVLGFYPGSDWDWPESRFFGFDRLLDGRSVEYQGPKIGYWKIPDQLALAKFLRLFPNSEKGPPRMTFFSSSTSHFPFHPVPPYQPDWEKAASPEPFEKADMKRVETAELNWSDMIPAYTGMLQYNFQWLTGYFQQEHPRSFVMLVLGDHQPAASVTGEGASWDVPVHLIASEPQLLERFLAAGFQRGMRPTRKAIGGLQDLTVVVLNALDSQK